MNGAFLVVWREADTDHFEAFRSDDAGHRAARVAASTRYAALRANPRVTAVHLTFTLESTDY